MLGGADDRGGPADDSDQLIWEVVGLARLEDGRIAVLSSMGKQLLLFEPSGALSRTIGRAGEGPGEFRGPEWLQYLPPDTLVVWDYFMSSISYFDTAGNLLRERRVDQARLREAGASGEAFVRPLPDGAFVVSVAGGPDNEVVESKGWNPRTSSLMARSGRVGNYARIDDGYRPQVLGPRSGIATGGDPTVDLLERARQERDPSAFAGRSPPANHTAHDRSDTGHGSGVPEHRGEGIPVRGGDGVTGAARHRGTDGREGGHPPTAGVLVDPEGYLWVREWSGSESGTPDQWSVFNPEGRWLGVLPFPWAPDPAEPNSCGGNTRVLCWVDRDFFLVVRQDELGVERVEGYRIRRGG